MYRVVILSFVFVVALADVDKKQCSRVFHPHAMHCCKKGPPPDGKPDDLSECFQLSRDPASCERDACLAKKRGFATDDGKLDKTKLMDVMTKDFVDDASLIEDVKKNCINGNYENYAPPEFCDFLKMRHCLSMQMLNHCSDWEDSSDCKEIKGLVADCVKLVS
ncbi:uncharacterized protein LOC110373347 [Helicoverpa armigera]|uniref:uncharacterized protein LOC110373347 n=1 Tax=Helicoverpa armigera TaxID=29058 RepID=UPI000B3963E2|nr:hypothetical protein B5X24_HaOG213700 [Helicoverpa armigera]